MAGRREISAISGCAISGISFVMQGLLEDDGVLCCNLAGIGQAKSIVYRPKSNGRDERAVQSTMNTLRQSLLSRKVSWLEALRLALWGLNHLPGAVAPYSPHWLVFVRDPIGVGHLPPVVDSEGCDDATQFFKRVAAERELVQETLEAI